MNILFYLAAAVAVLSTFMVITRLNPVHALIYLVVSLLSAALVFFTLGAPFVAALEVIIYAGAIMVLFVFVIMMLNLGPQEARQESLWLSPRTWIGPTFLAVVLLIELMYIFAAQRGRLFSVNIVGAKQVGIALLGPYILGVELASLLLLAGIVGAFYLGSRDARGTEKEGGRQ